MPLSSASRRKWPLLRGGGLGFALRVKRSRRHGIPGLPARDKSALSHELGERAGMALKSDPSAIVGALLARERLGSTGIGEGIAIPHARVSGTDQPFAMFARIEPPIDFEAIDRKLVDLVFLLITPDTGAAVHLSLLAAISRALRKSVTASALREAPTAREMFEVLKL